MKFAAAIEVVKAKGRGTPLADPTTELVGRWKNDFEAKSTFVPKAGYQSAGFLHGVIL